MKKIYKNRLPKNEEVKNTNVKIENGELIVEVEFKERFEPKDGDFVVTNNGCIFIYNSNYSGLCKENSAGFYVGVDAFGNIVINDGGIFSRPERLATEQEKSTFLKRIEKELHKKWNAGKKCLEDVRWRAEVGETFYYIDSSFCVNSMVRDEFHHLWKKYNSLEEQLKDERLNNVEYILWEKGNYFKTREAAEKVADKIKDILKNSKEE